MISERTFSLIVCAAFLALLAATLATPIRSAERSWHGLVCDGSGCPAESSSRVTRHDGPTTSPTEHSGKRHRV
jgi:hypothetical protein